MAESRKLKILLATGIYPPDIGGPATYVKTLAEELPKHGCGVKAVTYANEVRSKKSEVRSDDDEASGDNLEVRSDEVICRISRGQNIVSRYFKYFWSVYKLAKWADVVYVQDSVSSGLPTALACKLRRKNYLLKVVGDYAWEQGRQKYGVKDILDDFQDKKYGRNVEILRAIERWVAKGAFKIITPSEYLKKIVIKWGSSEDKIKVVYNAVKGISGSQENKEAAKAGLGVNGDIILSAGRLVVWKGFLKLVELMPALLKANSNFVLVIVGEGPDKEKLATRVKELNLGKNVVLTGGLAQSELWRYMRAAEMFALNTQYEGLSHIIVEAMKAGLPVIATRAGGNPEVVKDGFSGLLLEYNDDERIKEAILRIWRDKDLARSLQENAREDIKNRFNKNEMVSGALRELKAAAI